VVHHLFGATAFRAANPLVAGVTWLLERLVPALLRGLPCVAVSPSTRDDLVERGVAPGRVRVIPNGVDVTVSRYGADRFPRPTAIYLGRLRPYKGIDLLLRAADRLRARGIDMDVVVAGEGDDRTRLEALARALGLESRVTFTGYVSEDEKQVLLARSWLHVYPSPKEGWGITNLEAAAAGTATVASDSPGLRDSVEDGATGFLVEHGNVDALADAMQRLLDPAVRDRMGARARAFAEGYDWDRIADAFEAWLAEVARPAAVPQRP
jgi:glycosyltransferase involved in cell wall biosynthesis